MLVFAVLVVSALALVSLLVVGGAFGSERPLPWRLLMLTAAGSQVVLVLAMALVTLQALIEIVANLDPRS